MDFETARFQKPCKMAVFSTAYCLPCGACSLAVFQIRFKGRVYMFSHSTHAASFFSVLIAALIYTISLPGVAWAQGNTSLGTGALQNNTGFLNTPPAEPVRCCSTAAGTPMLFDGGWNTAIGTNSLFFNTTGDFNTAIGTDALGSNTTGDNNTAIGTNADVSAG